MALKFVCFFEMVMTVLMVMMVLTSDKDGWPGLRRPRARDPWDEQQ